MELKQIREKERREGNDRKRQKMVDAACRVFCRKGIEASTITDVAREAEFGEATVYRHFTNKENLVLSCGKKFWQMVYEFMDAKVCELDFAGKTGMEQVECLIHSAHCFYREHTELFRLIHDLDGFLLSHKMEKEQLKEYEQAVDRMRPCLCNAIEKGKADGSIQNSADTLVLYYAMTNGIFGLMQKQAAAGGLLASDLAVAQEEKLGQFLELLIAGMKYSYGRDEDDGKG